MMVKGKIYIGDINHSKNVAAEFLEHLAAECREEIKVMFDEVLPQTGFRRPVKIVAEKDTTKHRTRQGKACFLIGIFSSDPTKTRG